VTQPDYVPVRAIDRVRPAERLRIPGAWRQDRPAEQVELIPPSGACFGSTGPDLGYGLKLAKRFEHRLLLAPGEDAHDAVAAGFACGARRAASFGRAPVVYDMAWAYELWGYLGDAPDDLVDARVPFVRGASHDYERQRAVAAAVAPAALELTPAEVRERIGEWRSWLHID
jgi:hypothetical protein